MAKKFGQFGKNVMKSLGRTGLAVTKDLMPNLSTSIKENKDFVVEKYKTAKETPRNSEIQSTFLYRTTKSLISNALEDLKTGNLNNTDREKKAETDSFAAMFNIDMSIFDDELDLPEGDSVANDVNMGSFNISADFSEETTQDIKSIAKMSGANLKMLNVGMTHLTYQVSSLLHFNNQNTVRFYETVEQKLHDIGSSTEIMASYYKDLFENGQKKNTSSSNPLTDFMGMSGLNIKEWIDMYSRANEDSGFMSLAKMALDIGKVELQGIAANPLGYLSKKVVKTLMPKRIKNTMGRFDEMFGMLPMLVQGLGNSKNSHLRSLGKIFNLDRFKIKNNKYKYERGAISFDGVTKRAITQVIPGYLSRILTALSNRDKDKNLVYDYDMGKFVTTSDVKQKFDTDMDMNLSSSLTNSENNSETDELKAKALERAQKNGKIKTDDDKVIYLKKIDDALKEMSKKGKSFHSVKDLSEISDDADVADTLLNTYTDMSVTDKRKIVSTMGNAFISYQRFLSEAYGSDVYQQAFSDGKVNINSRTETKLKYDDIKSKFKNATDGVTDKVNSKVKNKYLKRILNFINSEEETGLDKKLNTFYESILNPLNTQTDFDPRAQKENVFDKVFNKANKVKNTIDIDDLRSHAEKAKKENESPIVNKSKSFMSGFESMASVVTNSEGKKEEVINVEVVGGSLDSVELVAAVVNVNDVDENDAPHKGSAFEQRKRLKRAKRVFPAQPNVIAADDNEVQSDLLPEEEQSSGGLLDTISDITNIFGGDGNILGGLTDKLKNTKLGGKVTNLFGKVKNTKLGGVVSKGLGKLGFMGKAGQAANTVGNVANVGKVANTVGNVANVGKVANTVSNVANVGKVANTVSNVANVGKVANTVGTVAKTGKLAGLASKAGTAAKAVGGLAKAGKVAGVVAKAGAVAGKVGALASGAGTAVAGAAAAAAPVLLPALAIGAAAVGVVKLFKKKPKKDKNGNVIYDKNGKPVMESTAKKIGRGIKNFGKKLIGYKKKVDENGEPVLDDEGNPIYEKPDKKNFLKSSAGIFYKLLKKDDEDDEKKSKKSKDKKKTLESMERVYKFFKSGNFQKIFGKEGLFMSMKKGITGDESTELGSSFKKFFGTIFDSAKAKISGLLGKNKGDSSSSSTGTASLGSSYWDEVFNFVGYSESGNDPGKIGFIEWDAGGKSYGAYQFASGVGSLKSFIDWMASHKDAKAREYAKRLNAVPFIGAEFDNVWQAIAKEDPEGFLKLQQERMKVAYYDPAIQTIKSVVPNFDPGKYTVALNALIMSTATQYGPYTNVLKNVFTSVSNLNDEAALIAAFRNVRTAAFPATANRYNEEYESSMALYNKYKGKAFGNGNNDEGGVTNNATIAKVLSAAKAVVDAKWPYVWGGESKAEGGFDCSGLCQYAYKEAGVNISRTTYTQIKDGTSVPINGKNNVGSAKAGDLLLSSPSSPGVPEHVMLYAGNNMVYEAANESIGLRYVPVEKTGFATQPVAIRRIINQGASNSKANNINSVGVSENQFKTMRHNEDNNLVMQLRESLRKYSKTSKKRNEILSDIISAMSSIVD